MENPMKLKIAFIVSRPFILVSTHTFTEYSDIEIKTKSQLKMFLKQYFSTWKGSGGVKILSVTSSFKQKSFNEVVAPKIEGQILDFNNGTVIFRRKSKLA